MPNHQIETLLYLVVFECQCGGIFGSSVAVVEKVAVHSNKSGKNIL